MSKLRQIKFLVQESQRGTVPEPVRAAKVMPDWYKRIKTDPDEGAYWPTRTVKACQPFADAMMCGYPSCCCR